MLKWMRDNRCPWNEGACQIAAGNGDLEMLEWLRNHGCPCDLRACMDAAKDAGNDAGNTEMVDCLLRDAPQSLVAGDDEQLSSAVKTLSLA